MSIPGDQEHIRLAANIPRYFIYTALKGFGFGLITAMWLIYLQQRRGLSLTQATFVDVAFWIAAALGEIPTGIVADTLGRKTSLIMGTALMSLSIFAWAAAPTILLIVLAYAGLAIGVTFLSGAEDALFFESIQLTGRTYDYTRLAGWASAIMLGATAVGSVASGLFASLDLGLPFLAAGVSLLGTLGIVFTLQEPHLVKKASERAHLSYGQILRQSFALMRARPALRSPMLYLALVPMAALIMETFFLQPQAVALGVPVAGIGVLVMASQFINMLGSTWSDRLGRRWGETHLFLIIPAIIVISLILLAALQALYSLLWIALISFVTAVLRPIVLNRIQNQLSDDVRATVLSMQSLLGTLLFTVSEPILGVIADRSGLPAAYVALSIGLGILVLLLFWSSRRHLFLPGILSSDPSEAEV